MYYQKVNISKRFLLGMMLIMISGTHIFHLISQLLCSLPLFLEFEAKGVYHPNNNTYRCHVCEFTNFATFTYNLLRNRMKLLTSLLLQLNPQMKTQFYRKERNKNVENEYYQSKIEASCVVALFKTIPLLIQMAQQWLHPNSKLTCTTISIKWHINLYKLINHIYKQIFEK